MDHAILLVLLSCVFGLLMTWGVGANDLANVMSTTMGSKAVTVRQALVIAVVFELLGALLGGTHVTQTMHNGIIDISSLTHDPQHLIYGMMSVLIAGMIWMNLASYLGLPVSITNAIVGSVVGFGAVVLGMHAVHWRQVGFIALSWVCSPILAGIAAFSLSTSIQTLVFARRDPLTRAMRMMPVYLFFVGLVLTYITVIKGLHHFSIDLSMASNLALATACGLTIMLIGLIPMRRIVARSAQLSRRERFKNTEKMFAGLMALTACAMVFAHGSNDVAVAIGPITVIVTMALHDGAIVHSPWFPGWVILLGATGVVLGLIFQGRKVIETVGSGITNLTPSRAFAATIAAATTVVVSTSTGVPVSATQTLVGAVLGVGLARGIGALNLVVIRNIFMSWIITLPVASLLTILVYHIIIYFTG